MRTRLPEDRRLRVVQDLHAALQALSRGQLSKEHAQKLAGTLISLTPAVPMTKLYVRALYAVIASSDSEALQRFMYQLLLDLQSWLDRLSSRQHIGKPMRPSGKPALVLIGDASAIGGGASLLVPDTGELLPVAVQSWTQQQQEQSSTHREMRQIEASVQAVLQHFPQLTQGRRLLYITDSQAATLAYLKMKGAPGIMEMDRHLYDITADADIQLDVSWRPRTDDAMQHADLLSRSEDAGLIYVTHAALMRICRTAHPGGGIWGLPTVDVFAGEVAHQYCQLSAPV